MIIWTRVLLSQGLSSYVKKEDGRITDWEKSAESRTQPFIISSIEFLRRPYLLWWRSVTGWGSRWRSFSRKVKAWSWRRNRGNCWSDIIPWMHRGRNGWWPMWKELPTANRLPPGKNRNGRCNLFIKVRGLCFFTASLFYCDTRKSAAQSPVPGDRAALFSECHGRVSQKWFWNTLYL